MGRILGSVSQVTDPKIRIRKKLTDPENWTGKRTFVTFEIVHWRARRYARIRAALFLRIT
jgi:hypothetical protein